MQIDVKEVPYCCLKGAVKQDGKRLYQWTAIDEFSRYRFVYGFEEHTPENSVKFLKLLEAAFPFKIEAVQTDNGTEFTYRYISEERSARLKRHYVKLGDRAQTDSAANAVAQREGATRNDQRYFYDWERFGDVDELNHKLREHLEWSNRKPMRTLGGKSPMQRLQDAFALRAPAPVPAHIVLPCSVVALNLNGSYQLTM